MGTTPGDVTSSAPQKRRAIRQDARRLSLYWPTVGGNHHIRLNYTTLATPPFSAMQLIWVSGPTSKVVTLSITARTIISGAAAVCVGLILLGFLFHFIGLRIAVEVSPSIAHALGGVASVADHERLEARYRNEIESLNERLGKALSHVGDLEKARQELLSLIGVRQQGIPRSLSQQKGGQGGPLRLLSLFDLNGPSLAEEFEATASGIHSVEDSLSTLSQTWHADNQRLQSLPVALPLRGNFYMSSSFGYRADPITGQGARHEGVDFVAPPGTPIRATGDGIVRRSEFVADLGHMIEIEHAEGYSSRYGHLSRRVATVGDRVERGQTIGHLGNSGRSTGPHLHYEVLAHGRLVDPNKALAPLAWR